MIRKLDSRKELKMNKRNLILGVGLVIVVIVTLLISASKPETLVTGASSPSKEQQISRPVADFTNSARYSGDDLYDPSIHPFLLATQQACVPNFSGYDTYQPAVKLNCDAQAADPNSAPVANSNEP
jgi:hypothetical protein